MDDIERQLLEAERPEPRGEVRARVLAATMPLVRPDASRLDRVWFSPRWRMASVLVFVVLVGIDLVPQLMPDSALMPQDHPTADITQAVAMAALEVGLTPDDAAALCAQALAAAKATTMIPPDADALVRGSNQ